MPWRAAMWAAITSLGHLKKYIVLGLRHGQTDAFGHSLVLSILYARSPRLR